MIEGTGEYRGGQNGGYARVHVAFKPDRNPVSVQIVLDNHAWNNQLREGGFNDWMDAALVGSNFAVAVANLREGNIEIVRIVGLQSDTTSAYVGIAAALGTWNALNFCPTDANESSLREFIDRNMGGAHR